MNLKYLSDLVHRVYFGIDGDALIILLCGGDKGSQDDDLRKAKKYWEDYRKGEI